MRIQPSHENLIYCGRIDWSDSEAPVFVYPCTSVQMRFTGNVLKIYVRNYNAYWDNYLGYILDGKQGRILLPPEGDAAFEIKVEQTTDREHELMLFKRQDACHELVFLGVEIGEGERILKGPVKSERRMEVYGDSVSAGEVSEAVDYVGKEDPQHNGEYSNSWYSYSWMTARKLDAQIHDIAQGGIALMDKTGWFYEPEAVGMETVWDKIHYNPVLGKPMQWNFNQYIPQVVIVAIGQNDSHPQDYMAYEYENKVCKSALRTCCAERTRATLPAACVHLRMYARVLAPHFLSAFVSGKKWRCKYEGERAFTWREHYKNFLKKIRGTYPDARIICCTTLLNHDKAWDVSIGQVVQELKDEKITQYLFKRNGSGTPGHLRIPEAQEMADELATYISKLEIEGWS